MTNFREDEQKTWVCGRCKVENFHLATEEPSETCVVCGYRGHTRPAQLPPEIKIDISRY